MPNVERALTEMESGIGGPAAVNMSAGGDAVRKLASRGTGRPSASGLSVPNAPSGGGRSQASSPTLPSTPNPNGGQASHEVLQNFFASLLSTKPSNASPAKSPPSKTSSPEKGAEEDS